LPARFGADIRTPPVSPGFRARSSAGEHLVDIEGVTGSIPVAPTIQSRQTADFGADFKEAVSVGISAHFIPPCRSLVAAAVSRADFGVPVSAFKNSVPRAAGLRRAWAVWQPGIMAVMGAKKRHFETGRNYCGFKPSASNCWLHSDGASRNRSTPMPRGSRPSTAALTRSGARKASEMVRLTWRKLHFCRAAIC
jgi:hypothetical protein